MFCNRGLLRGSPDVSIEEKVALFLHMVAHNQHNRTISFSFDRSSETVSRYFRQVLRAISVIYPEYIRGPSNAVHPKIASSHRFWPYFQVTKPSFS